jgi:hypothetical protein
MLLLLLVALWLRLRACTVHTDCCMLASLTTLDNMY